MLITAILAVLLTITVPCLKDAQADTTVEGACLTGKAVLLIGASGAAFLAIVVASRCIAQVAATFTGILIQRVCSVALLIPAICTVPPAITELWL